MSVAKNQGRFAGLLYILTSIIGFVGLGYVPDKLIVAGNASATVSNIAASETLFRLGIASNLIGQAGFIFVALALYDLLKGINRRHSSLMVILIVVSVPIAFLNELNSIAALFLAKGADFVSVLDKPQREALAMLFLKLHGRGFVVAELFWGDPEPDGHTSAGIRRQGEYLLSACHYRGDRFHAVAGDQGRQTASGGRCSLTVSGWLGGVRRHRSRCLGVGDSRSRPLSSMLRQSP